jgi:hypothetical protein
MTSRSLPRPRRRCSSDWARLAIALPAILFCGSCARKPLDGSSSPVDAGFGPFPEPPRVNTNLDILFMIDDSSSMTAMQQKLLAQLPTFMQTLQALPMGLPSIHVAVVSSDMGAPSDQGIAIGCDSTGQAGAFQIAPRGTCVSNDFSVATDTSWISDNASGTEKNFSDADPAGIAKVFSCIALLGSSGCGFEHQLASIDRALGADNPDAYGNAQPPSTNAGFVRDGAYLAIIMLTNEDDCSAPAGTSLYSLNGGNQDLSNPLGPIANYRCNQFGHLCEDPNGPNPTMLEAPPLNPPSDATGPATTPMLSLTNCRSNDTESGMLTPVSKFISDIKALKRDPDNQILVAAIVGPTTPYTAEWLPVADPDRELWPQVAHSCTSGNGDGSFADPPVRIAQFVAAFGNNGVTASICDDDYASSMKAIAARLGTLFNPRCVGGTIQTDTNGNPDCEVINQVTTGGATKNIVVASCADNGGSPPCWTLTPPDATNGCPAATRSLNVSADPTNPNPDGLTSVIRCSTCSAGVPNVPGCP